MILPKLKITQSATIEINSLALKKAEAGEKIYNLSAGEPMVNTSDIVRDAAIAAIVSGRTHYSPVAGIPELRQAACAWVNRAYGCSYGVEESVVTCGGKFGIYALCRALLEPGDEAILFSPFWVSYTSIIELCGAVPKIIQTAEKNGWKPTMADIEKSINSRTKVLILNNASNPNGVLYTREEIESILALTDAHDIAVISDEVYSGLVYEGEFASCGSFPKYKDNVAVIQSCSKHFAMTGWRVGLVFANAEIIKCVASLQSQSTTGTSTISQWAAVSAFQNAEIIIADVKSAMKERRDLFISTLNKIFGISLNPPASSLYIFLSLKDLRVENMDSKIFCQKAMEEGNIALVPGVAFGQEGYIRLSFGSTPDDLVEALQAFGRYLKKA